VLDITPAILDDAAMADSPLLRSLRRHSPGDGPVIGDAQLEVNTYDARFAGRAHGDPRRFCHGALDLMSQKLRVVWHHGARLFDESATVSVACHLL
jgi:hypothetical protein